MNEASLKATTSTGEFERPQIGFLDCLIVLAKRKRLVVGVPVVSAVIAAGLSFAIPNVYLASTKLMPPQQSQSGAAALLSQLGGVAGAVAGSAGLKNPNDLYIGMLKSRTVADKLIAKFNLQRVYDTDSPEKARKALEQNTVISSAKDGLITISVEDKDKKLVAQLANGYVNELFDLTKVLAISEAAKRRLFFERQLEQAKDNLASAEVALKNGLESRGVISVDSESRVVLETVGRLRAQVSSKEIQLNSMSAFVTTTNPEYRKVQEELASLRGELSKLENGRSEEGDGDQKFGKQAGLQSIKLLRDVKYYQMLYELLAKQFEVARLDEAKDPSIVQVLDPAIEPERKFKPKRAVVVLATFFVSLMAVVCWAFIREGVFVGIGDAKNSEKWGQFKSYLRGKS
jgi:uncharacterized protein involved in exopolysaccharide biosynthesis